MKNKKKFTKGNRKKAYNLGLTKSSIFSSKVKGDVFSPINADARKLMKPIDGSQNDESQKKHRLAADAILLGYPKELRFIYTEELLSNLEDFMLMKISESDQRMRRICSITSVPVLKFLRVCRRIRTGPSRYMKKKNLIQIFLYGSKAKGIKPFDESILHNSISNFTSLAKPQLLNNTVKPSQQKVEDQKKRHRPIHLYTPITPDKFLNDLKITLDDFRKKMDELKVRFNRDGELERDDAKIVLESYGRELKIITKI